MNPTTDSQALLTKTFLHFIPFFFFFFFSPLSIVFAQQQLHTTFPYSLLLCPTNVQHSNYRSTISTLSIYHSIYFIYINIMQGSKSHTVTDSQSQKPKTKKKTQTVQFRLQRFSRTTQAPNQTNQFSNFKHTSTVSLILRISDHRFTRF